MNSLYSFCLIEMLPWILLLLYLWILNNDQYLILPKSPQSYAGRYCNPYYEMVLVERFLTPIMLTFSRVAYWLHYNPQNPSQAGRPWNRMSVWKVRHSTFCLLKVKLTRSFPPLGKHSQSCLLLISKLHHPKPCIVSLQE